MNEPTSTYEASGTNETAPAGDDELLAAFVGPKNAHYYAGAFNAFARGENVKWNWPAFFVTFFWMLHRKMWMYAVGYIIGLHVIMQLMFMYGGVSYSSQFLLSLIVNFVVIPLFATRLYYAHARSKIGSINGHIEKSLIPKPVLVTTETTWKNPKRRV